MKSFNVLLLVSGSLIVGTALSAAQTTTRAPAQTGDASSTPPLRPVDARTRNYVVDFEIASHTATGGFVNVTAPDAALLAANPPPPGSTRRYVRAFASMSPMDAKSLRTSAWKVAGEYAVEIRACDEVFPVHEITGGIAMGEGETLFGHTYRYMPQPAWHGRHGSAIRAFEGYANGYFHNGQWRMGRNGTLAWRHEFGGRRFSGPKVALNVSRAETPWAVDAAVDGGEWRQIAGFDGPQKKAIVALPDGTNIAVRVRAAGEKGFCLWNYSFEAKVDGEPGYRVGRTDFRRADGSLVTWPDAPVKPYAKGALLASTDGGLRLWTADAGWKVFPENPLPTEQTDAIRIKTAANEAECAQLVVTPTRPVAGMRVDVSEPPACAKAALPAAATEVLKVSYVNVRIPTDNTCAVGRWPDPIERQTAGGCKVAANESQPFWIRVKPPKGTLPGIYRGTLEVRADGIAPQRVPLEVEVFGFELPDAMTCETAFGCRVHNIVRNCRLTTLADKRKMFDTYFRILGEHHLSVYDPDPTTPLKVEWKGLDNPVTAVPAFNWDEWDAAIEKSLREYHANTIRVRIEGLGGGTYEHRFEPEIAGFREGTPEYDVLIGRYLRAMEEHLKGKGWLEKAYVYTFDEPAEKDYPFVTNMLAKLKRHAPGIRRMLTEEADRALLGGVNLWCPVTSNFHKGENVAARASGDTFWWYVCCSPKAPYATEFIDKPGTEMRVWLWQTWKENVTGILVWDTIYWSGGTVYGNRDFRQDCWDDTQCWCDSASHPYPYNWGNGDGRFLYPPRATRDRKRREAVLDPPVETYRLEILRDGIEDYEYFALLRKLDPENALLSVPPDVTASMTEFTRDPAPMMRHRERLAREIVRLGGGSENTIKGLASSARRWHARTTFRADPSRRPQASCVRDLHDANGDSPRRLRCGTPFHAADDRNPYLENFRNGISCRVLYHKKTSRTDNEEGF